jgi:hypothetical protein
MTGTAEKKSPRYKIDNKILNQAAFEMLVKKILKTTGKFPEEIKIEINHPWDCQQKN